jgi:alkylation response protein AidB-like acyl-CoA dehydrogenase
MDFSIVALDARMQRFQLEVRRYIEENISAYDQNSTDRHAHDPALHKAICARGWWHRSGWPLQQGLAPLDALSQHVVELELERAGATLLAREITELALPGIIAYASESVKAAILPRILAGDSCVCLGYTEADAGSDLAGIKTRAIRNGGDWVLNGAKVFTTAAQYCEYSFLLARTDPEASKHKGLTMFLAPLNDPGVEIRPIGTLGDERTNFVFFSDVRIPDDLRLGREGEGWAVLSRPLNAEHGIATEDAFNLGELNTAGSDSVRAMRQLVDEAAAWAVTSGRAQHPVVRRRIAQAALDAEVCRNTPGPMGKVLASESLIRNSSDFIDMIGPQALLPKGAKGHIGDGFIEWAHRHAQVTATYGGTNEILRNIIAERFLGLPRG